MSPSALRFLIANVSTLLLLTTPAVAATNVVRTENARAGTSDWRLIKEANGEIEGYASAVSVDRGGVISVYVNTSEPSYSIDVFRTGWYAGLGARRMSPHITRAGIRQAIPAPDPDTGIVKCNWQDPYTITVGDDWPSGVYLALLTAGVSGAQKYVTFVVRDDRSTSDHLFVLATNTSQAYNNWGGKSLYPFNSTGAQAVKVSDDRPFAQGSGTGQYLWRWSYSAVRFLEREGYDVSYTTDLDVDSRGALLLNHHDIVFVGHDEYWSRAMRTNVEAARDRGVNLAFFGGNMCYWQIRYESDDGVAGRTIVAYKESALQKDPYATSGDPAQAPYVTTRWRNAPVNEPEEALVGTREVYPSVSNGDIVVQNTSNWIFAGTHLRDGDRLKGLLGYEVDATGAQTPAGAIVVGHSPFGDTSTNPPTTRYSDMTLYTTTGANPATVFSAGSIQWAWGLDDWRAGASGVAVSPAAQQITRNILDRFGGHRALPNGDATGDGVLDASDVFHLVNFLFAHGSGPIGPADANGDGSVTAADVFFLLDYLYGGGPAPAEAG